jgi:hypothetical protein
VAEAMTATETGFALSWLLILRWTGPFSASDVNPLRSMLAPARIDHRVESLRKRLSRHRCSPHNIWVHEAAESVGKHWHIALRGKNGSDAAPAKYIAKLTGEPRAHQRRGALRLPQGEFACGECASWHLARDKQPDRCGYVLAVYLGKGELSQRLFRGHLRNNTQKPLRGHSFRGSQPDRRYDSAQALIERTA